MKKITSMILSICMLLAIVATLGISVAAAPEGTAINSAADFAAMAADGKYYLNADITLDATYGLPVGEAAATVFTGTLDGNGKTVTITTNAMFAEVNNATISNLTVKGDLNPGDALGYAVGSQDFFAAVAIVANGTSTFKNITSDVNFTATASTTRWGAIAATSAKDHAILIENCVSNGTINIDSYAGGIYGWSDKIGNSTVKNCINNGDLNIATGYGAGVVARLCGSGEGGTITVENCINNGNVTLSKSYGGGIMAYTNTPNVIITGCVNNGNISTAGHAAGIVASLGEPKANPNYVFTGNINNGNVTTSANNYAGGIVGNIGNPKKGGMYTFNYNINNGDITGAGNDTGGIIGYAYGRGTAGDEAYAVLNGNVNTGTIKNAKWASQLLCYTNDKRTTVTNCIAIGKVVLDGDTEPAEDAGQRVFIGLSSSTILDYVVSGNYYIENDGTVMYSYATAADNAANRIAFADRPEGAITVITAAQIADAVAAVNTALGSTVFEIKDGKIALVCDHEYLNEAIEAVAPTCTSAGKAAGFKCAACGEVVGCEEVAATAHTYADGKCTACGAADPAAGPDVSGPTGDSAVIYIAIAVLAVLGTAVVAKKREN